MLSTMLQLHSESLEFQARPNRTVDSDGEVVVSEPWAKESVFWPATNFSFFVLGGMIDNSTHASQRATRVR